MRRSPPKSTVDDVPRPTLPPNGFKSSAPPVVIQVWVDLTERMDRRTLDRFTRDIWARFDAAELEPLRAAILRRRRILARCAWP